MGIFRHSNLLLQRVTPGSDDADSGTIVVRPSDGDGVNDKEQEFFMLIFIDQQGAGTVRFNFLTSFGDGLWARIATRELTADGQHLLLYRRMDGFAPYIQVRIQATAPSEGAPKPTFRCVVRLASSGPYRALPATVPNTIEQAATEEPGDPQPPGGP